MNGSHKLFIKSFALTFFGIIFGLNYAYASAPTVGIVVSPSTIISGGTSTVTFTFSEPVTGFDNTDINVESGTLSTVTSSDNTIWTATFTPSANTTASTNVITVDNSTVMDIDTSTAGIGNTEDSNNYSVDTDLPTLSSINIESNNSNTSFAKLGDVLTLSLAVSESLNTPDVTIKGHTVSVTDTGSYTASYTMQASDSVGVVPFTISFSDLLGNVGVTVSTTTDSSSVTYYKSAPTLSSVTISSNNTNGSTLSKVGNTITLSFASDRILSSPTVTIAGQSATTTGSGPYTSTYIMTASSSEGTIPFTVDFTDQAGNAGTQVTTLTSGSSITFDKTAPSAPIISSIATDNRINNSENSAVHFIGTAESGSTINVSLTDGTTTITGSGTTTGGNYDITINTTTLTDGTTTPAVTTTDAVGNISATTSLPLVIKEITVPTLTSVTISSNNASTTLAKVGNTITVSFTASKALATPTVTIDSQSATTTNTSGNNWTATYVMTSNQPTGLATTSISFSDLSGNAGVTVSTTTNASSVTFDKTQPTLSISMGSYSFGGGDSTLVTFTFSEKVTGFDNSDISADNGFISTATSTDGGIVWTTSFTPNTGTSVTTNIIMVGTGVTDLTGNILTSTSTSANYVVNTLGTLSGGGGGGGGGGSSSATLYPTSSSAVAATTGAAVATTASTETVSAPTGAVLGIYTVNFKSDLKVGSKGTDVTELQKILIKEGLLNSEPTGYFGKATQDALKKLQSKNKLPANGLFGPMTRSLLSSKDKVAVKTTPTKVAQTSATSATPATSVTTAKKTTTPTTPTTTAKKTEVAVKEVAGLPVVGPKVLSAFIFNFKSDLHIKSQGEAVKELQKILVAEGFLKGEPLGSFEKSTEDALKKWQAKKGLAPTGYFGPTARNLLKK